MKPKIHHTLLIYFLLISNLGFSQDKKDTLNLKSPLLFPQFTEGTVIFKDGSSNRAMLNYDTSLDEMQFIGPKGEILSCAQPEKMGMVKIGNRDFVNSKSFFLEILVEGNVSLCLRVHQKRFSERIGAYGGTSAASSVGNYSSYTSFDGSLTKLKANVSVSYLTEYFFYIWYYGKFKMILSLKDLYRYFPENKELLKQEMQKQNTRFDDIASMKKIINWINARGIKN